MFQLIQGPQRNIRSEWFHEFHYVSVSENLYLSRARKMHTRRYVAIFRDSTYHVQFCHV
jgi:hypothetical protein